MNSQPKKKKLVIKKETIRLALAAPDGPQIDAAVKTFCTCRTTTR